MEKFQNLNLMIKYKYIKFECEQLILKCKLLRKF